MIIVLEGPDCAGKTTTAAHLKEQYPNAVVFKQGPPSGDILRQYLKPIENFMFDGPNIIRLGGAPVLILDRWHVGERIYGPLLRGKSLLTEQQADYIDMVLQSFGAWFFHVTAPLRVLQDRYDLRSDDLIKREQLQRIQLDYMQHMVPRNHWAFVRPSIDAKNWPMTMHIDQSPMAGQYIGPDNPKVLLIGDERNDDNFVFPFVPTRASSGHWLMGALHAAHVKHMSVGIINGSEIAPHILFEQWWKLGKPPVITLGKKAQMAWRIASGGDWSDRTHYLNHPQYERRFRYTKMERYGATIKEVMNG